MEFNKKFKKYFIPHKENDYKPHILRPRTVLIILAWIFVAEFFVLLQVFVIFPKSKILGMIFPATIVDFTNSYRVANNLLPLQDNALLQEAAQAKANDMAKNGYFAHTSPAGLSPWYWFVDAGYNFSYAGENLAVNFSDSKDVMDAWMNSPEHKANILDSNYTQIGVATAEGIYNSAPATFIVQEFGTPVSSNSVSQIIKSTQSSTITKSNQTILNNKIIVENIIKKTTSSVALSVGVMGISTSSNFGVLTTANASSAKNISTTVLIRNSSQKVSSTIVSSINNNSDKNFVSQANFTQTMSVIPHTIVSYIFMGLFILILLSLATTILIKIKVQHPILIVDGISLIIIIAVFIVVNQNIFYGMGKIL